MCCWQDMLFRRTCLLVDYEDANRALDKAKPAKRKAVCHHYITQACHMKWTVAEYFKYFVFFLCEKYLKMVIYFYTMPISVKCYNFG